jgi:hypothetical protein
MLTYEYHCERNRKTVQVRHGIREKIATWGELRQRAGLPADDTPDDATVERLIFGGQLASVNGGTPSSVEAAKAALPMMSGCCGNPSGCSRHG